MLSAQMRNNSEEPSEFIKVYINVDIDLVDHFV